MSYRIYKLLTILIIISSLTFAQEKSFQEQQDSTSKANSISSIDGATAINNKINFNNETGNSIITITDEGSNKGSITLPNMTAPPILPTYKLYNLNGVLNFNNSALGAGGVTEIDDLSDAKYDGPGVGPSLFIGALSGSYDDGSNNYNTGIGYQSLRDNISGSSNTAIGFNALIENETGSGNTAVGHSLSYNKSGHQNTAIGYLSLHKNVSAINNTAVGYWSLRDNEASDNSAFGTYSLYQNTTGFGNTAIGNHASSSNTIGRFNIALGYGANKENVEGNYNTVVGYKAGYGSTGVSNSGNVFVGYRAGYNEAGSNKLYIENSNSATPLIWGDFTDGSEQVKINGNFHVTGNVTSDGTGLGVSELNGLIDAKTVVRSVYLGNGSGNSDDGTDNQNTAIGYNALNDNTSGFQNVSIGESSMLNNTTGERNTVIGQSAMRNNNTGNRNTVIGEDALYGNSTGSGNVALGNNAGFSETGSNKLYIENSISSSPLIWGDFATDSVQINGDLSVTGTTKIGDGGVPITEIKLIEGTTSAIYTTISYPVGYTQTNTFLISCKVGPLTGGGAVWDNVGPSHQVSFTETDIVLSRSISSTRGYKMVIMKIE